MLSMMTTRSINNSTENRKLVMGDGWIRRHNASDGNNKLISKPLRTRNNKMEHQWDVCKEKTNKINNDCSDKLAMMTTMATRVTDHKLWKGKWEIVKRHRICCNECHQRPSSNDESWLSQPLYLQFMFLLQPEAIEESFCLCVHSEYDTWAQQRETLYKRLVSTCLTLHTLWQADKQYRVKGAQRGVQDGTTGATYWFTKCWLIPLVLK